MTPQHRVEAHPHLPLRNSGTPHQRLRSGRKVLRVGVVQRGRVVAEQLVRQSETFAASQLRSCQFGEAVTAGADARLSAEFRLFETHAGDYCLNVTAHMAGSVATSAGRKSLAALREDAAVATHSGQRYWRLRLDPDARGRIELGDAAVVFHFVAPPEQPVRAPLPRQWQASPLSGIDWFTTVVAAFSFLLHFLAVALIYSDWADDVVDGEMAVTQLVEQVHRLPPPPALEKPRVDAASEASAFAKAAAKAPAASPSTARSGAGRGAQSRVAADNRAASGGRASGNGRAAEIASELAALELSTLMALGTDGPSTQAVIGDGKVPVALLDDQARSERGASDEDPGGLGIGKGPGADSLVPGERQRRLDRIGVVERAGDRDATEVGVAKKVEGPKGHAIVAPPLVAAGQVANASSVVGGMRGRFRSCYHKGLAVNPELAGAVTMVARIGPNGEVQSVSGGGGGLSIIVPCLRAVVGGGAFSAPTGGSAIISIPIQFVRR